MTTMNRVLGRSALVAYGSETGNAQDIAEELGRIAERLRFWTRVSCLDAVELVCKAQDVRIQALKLARRIC